MSSNPQGLTLSELAAKRARASVVRALETAVKRMEDKAQEARRELQHIEKLDTQELTRLVARIISLGAWSHANIVGDLTNAISDVGEMHHVEGAAEATTYEIDKS